MMKLDAKKLHLNADGNEAPSILSSVGAQYA